MGLSASSVYEDDKDEGNYYDDYNKDPSANKYTDIPLHPEGESLQKEHDAALHQRKIRKLIRYLQQSLYELRNADEDSDQNIHREEIQKIIQVLDELGVPRDTYMADEDVWEDAKELHSVKKTVTFPNSPKLAFYEPEMGRRIKPPMQKHASLEEINRHAEEMEKAYKDSKENPLWLNGGRRRRPISRRQLRNNLWYTR